MSPTADRLYESLLIVRCQTGDPSAWRELVDRFTPRLAYFLRKFADKTDRIDDLLQEVWLDVHRQLPRLNDATAFPAWVYRIARGKAALAVRRNEVSPVDDELLNNAAGTTDEPVFTVEDAERVHRALDRLPVAQREAIVLRFIEGFSYDEIARATDNPIGTVRSRIHHAKQSLRRLLE